MLAPAGQILLPFEVDPGQEKDRVRQAVLHTVITEAMTETDTGETTAMTAGIMTEETMAIRATGGGVAVEAESGMATRRGGGETNRHYRWI